MAASSSSSGPPPLKVQNVTTDSTCTFDFQLDGVSESVQSEPGVEGQALWNRISQKFGPGFVIAVEKLPNDPRFEPKFGIYLLLEKDIPPMTVTLSVAFSSFKGGRWQGGPHVLFLSYGTKAGFSTSFGSLVRLSKETQIVCKATLRYETANLPSLQSLPQSSLDLLHTTIVGGSQMNVLEVSKIRIFAYTSRDRNGMLRSPREMHVSPDALANAGQCMSYDTGELQQCTRRKLIELGLWPIHSA